jgi:hypothetical protein
MESRIFCIFFSFCKRKRFLGEMKDGNGDSKIPYLKFNYIAILFKGTFVKNNNNHSLYLQV